MVIGYWVQLIIKSNKYYVLIISYTYNRYPIIPRPVCDDKGIRPITMLAKQLATVGDVRYMVCTTIHVMCVKLHVYYIICIIATG